MKRSQRRRLAKKTPRQLARMRRKKVKKEKTRQEREAEMAEHLLSKGWKRCGPYGEVWKIDHWKHQRESYGFERGYMRIPDLDGEGFKTVYSKREPRNWAADEVKMSLRKAYEAQLRLDAIGYVKPKGLDDDLADLI